MMPSLMFIIVLVLATFTSHVGSLCTFPAGLRGEFISNKYGLLVFNDTHVSGFNPVSAGCRNNSICGSLFSPYVFHCLQHINNNKYLLSSPQYVTDTSSGQVFNHGYVCWNLEKVSNNKWIYYQAPKASHGYFGDYIVANTTPPTATSVCDLGDPPPASRIEILLKKDVAASTSCPTELMGTFTLTGGTCSTRYDVCSTRMRERIVVDDPSCLPGTSLQNPTTMDCVYFVSENDVSYLMTYDSTRGGFSFTCSAFSTSDQEVYMTHQKDVCDGIKLPTASSSSFILSADAFCPLVEEEEEEEDKADGTEDGTETTNIVIAIVITAVLLVLLAVVVGLLCRKVKTKRQQKKVADGGAGHRSGPSDGASDVNGGLCVKE